MTEQGFKNRLFSIEWHANLWRPFCYLEHVEAMMRYCTEVQEARLYGMDEPLPDTGDPMLDDVCIAAERYFDQCVFNGGGPTSFE